MRIRSWYWKKAEGDRAGYTSGVNCSKRQLLPPGETSIGAGELISDDYQFNPYTFLCQAHDVKNNNSYAYQGTRLRVFQLKMKSSLNKFKQFELMNKLNVSVKGGEDDCFLDCGLELSDLIDDVNWVNDTCSAMCNHQIGA